MQACMAYQSVILPNPFMRIRIDEKWSNIL